MRPEVLSVAEPEWGFEVWGVAAHPLLLPIGHHSLRSKHAATALFRWYGVGSGWKYRRVPVWFKV